MRKPELKDFGITPEEYRQYRHLSQNPMRIAGAWLYILLLFPPTIVGIIVFGAERELGVTIVFGSYSFFLFGFLTITFVYFFNGYRKSRMERSPTGLRGKQYEKSLAYYSNAFKEAEKVRIEKEQARRTAEHERLVIERAERKKLRQFWQSLRGIQFERELATLYRNLGYEVQFTPKSGDQGIDLILIKNGRTTIVQCKGQKGPTSPAVVRELYGSLAAFDGAHHAVLACNGGFTQGVNEFASGKPITLISANEIARMGESALQIHPLHQDRI